MRSPGECLSRPLRAPLVAHAAALAIIMLALLPLVGWHGVLSTDEGAAIAQARSLSSGEGFGLPHPFPAADPSGNAFPFEKAAEADDGYAPLPKKPTYTLLLAAADRIAGVPAMLVLSAVGTIAAAVLTARVGRLLHASLEVPTFWMTGLASPLFIDGYLVIAHSISAAFCAAALLLSARALRSRDATALVPLGLVLSLAILLRAEAVLFGLALATGAGILALRRTQRAASVAAVAVATTAVAYGLDRLLSGWLFGETVDSGTSVPASDGRSYMADRVRGLLITWVRPGYGRVGAAGLLLIVIALLGMVAVRELRKDAPDLRAVRALAATAVALAIARSVIPGSSPQLVPGLIVAFPLLLWGLVALSWSRVSAGLPLLLASTGATYAFAVVSTQYAVGGGFEWGGRYFAAGLPCAIPLVAAGLRQLVARLDVATAWVCLAATAVPAIVLAGIGLDAVHTNRNNWETFTQAVVSEADLTSPGDGGPSVVISTLPEPPRAAWRELEQDRWLLVAAPDLAQMLERLHDLGIRELLLVTRGSELQTMIDDSPYEVIGPDVDVTSEAWWLPRLGAR